MKTYAALLLIGSLALTSTTICAADTSGAESPEIIDRVLLNRALQVAAGKDVIIDRVTLPPNTALSRRWHPGEMFVYVIEGAVSVTRDGEPETVFDKGALIEVPLKHVYAARTNSEAAELVIFRVHEAGQPMRVIID